jgi:mycothione reductase
MRSYDVVVVGSGAGASVAARAVREGHSVALIDHGPLGGTCPNTGCIPSKMLIHPADRICEIRHAARLGIDARIHEVDVPALFARMRAERIRRREITARWIDASEGLDYYPATARFTGDHTLDAGGTGIVGEKIFIATGSRPALPPAEGIETVDVLTNESLLELDRLPESLVIIGGGYVAVEYGHFFSALGSAVTIIQRGDRILTAEDPELSERLRQTLSTRMAIHTGIEAVSMEKDAEGCTVVGRERRTGKEHAFSSERILVAAGRRSNADLLDVARSGVATDGHGFIRTDACLETTRERIWAIGDANGKAMFRHAANEEARIAWHNATGGEKIPMDYSAVPHAVFTYPPLASVGITEPEARANHAVLVGSAPFTDVARGVINADEGGVAKAVVDATSGRILGFHILGPGGPEIIHEMAAYVREGRNVVDVPRMRIHPTIAEIITHALDPVRYRLDSSRATTGGPGTITRKRRA